MFVLPLKIFSSINLDFKYKVSNIWRALRELLRYNKKAQRILGLNLQFRIFTN